MNEPFFIDSTLQDYLSIWDVEKISRIANLSVPESVLGRQKTLLRADVNIQWARWFVESLADPLGYLKYDFSYPTLFSDVLTAVNEKFNQYTKNEKVKIASSVARILQSQINRMKSSLKRQQISRKDKDLLLELAGNPPRCWICGAIFSNEAVDNYLYRKSTSIRMPKFIDIFFPRGLNQRDLTIEIDHIVAHSLGGSSEDNLALACGWCNRNKNNYLSIYDTNGQPKKAVANSIGVRTLPHPFWSIRLLSTVRICEFLDGCASATSNSNLTITSINQNGSMNPTNIRVTCYEHDNLQVIRLQPPNIVRHVWGM